MACLNLPNGHQIPQVGLGCGAIKQDEVEQTLRVALESGYRLFDCAYLYGNESWIGEAFENIFSEGMYKREDIFITSKLPMIANSPERVERFLQKSLHNLRISYIDLYLIHFPVGFQYVDDDTLFPQRNGKFQLDFNTTDNVALWRAMEDQVKAGRARAIGVSNFSVEQLKELLPVAEIPPANLQIEIHAYFQQKEIRKFCENNGIVVSAYAPLGSPGRREVFRPKGIPKVLSDPVVISIANKYGKTPAQILLKFFVVQNVVVLPKSSCPVRIRSNIDLFCFNLTDEEIQLLRLLDRGEEGRSFDYLKIFDGLENHPQNPIPLGSQCTEENNNIPAGIM